MAKHVVFVLDTSGSMNGKKIKQTKSAIKTILSELRQGKDYFTLITFSDDSFTWRLSGQHVIHAANDTLEAAISHVRGVEPRGGTNVNAALVEGLKAANSEASHVQPMVIFLTDGHATTGVTDRDEILGNAAAGNGKKVPVFSLAFGRQADFELLKILSLQNDAFARKIYVAGKTSLQNVLFGPFSFGFFSFQPMRVSNCKDSTKRFVTKHAKPKDFLFLFLPSTVYGNTVLSAYTVNRI